MRATDAMASGLIHKRLDLLEERVGQAPSHGGAADSLGPGDIIEIVARQQHLN